MKYFLPKDMTITASNIGDDIDENGDTYTLYNMLLGNNKGDIRKYGNNIYTSLKTIYPLAHFRWEDLISGSEYGVNLHTQTDIHQDGSNELWLDIVDGVTIVYVQSNETYYVSKHTGSIDFMAEDITTPVHFTAITATPPPYRHEYNVPLGTSNTLYWGYTSVANKFRAFDKAMSSQTTRADEITYTLDIKSATALVVLNTNVSDINLVVTDNLKAEELFNSTQQMIDTTLLDNYEKVCTLEPIQKENAVFIFDTGYDLTIDLTLTNTGDDAKVGVIKAGLLDTLGKTLDGVDVTSKSYNESGQRDNGERVWNPEDLETNKVFVLQYNIKMDTFSFDSNAKKLKFITDKEVVLLGDDGDEEGYTTLINYGAITDTNANLRNSNTKSNGSISIENLI